MQGSGQSSVTLKDVSTRLGLGLGLHNEKSKQKVATGNASSSAPLGGVAQQLGKSNVKMSSGEEDQHAQIVAKLVYMLEGCQRELRERVHYGGLMERENYQLQEAVKYFRNNDKAQTYMFEQQLLLIQVQAQDEIDVQTQVLKAETKKVHDIFLIQQAQMEVLQQTVLQQKEEIETLREQLLQQQNATILKSCEVSSLSSELKKAKDIIMAASKDATCAQPDAENPMYLSSGPAVCLHCQEPASSGSDLEPIKIVEGKSTTSSSKAMLRQ